MILNTTAATSFLDWGSASVQFLKIFVFFDRFWDLGPGYGTWGDPFGQEDPAVSQKVTIFVSKWRLWGTPGSHLEPSWGHLGAIGVTVGRYFGDF